MKKPMLDVMVDDRTVTFTRVFDAPRELVFETYSKCEHLEKWWGPRTWPLAYCEMDFREGGEWHYCMRGPDGGESWGKAVYREIVESERIVFMDYFSDADGNVDESMPGSRNIVEFTDLGDKTRVSTTGEYTSPEVVEKILEMGMVEGFTESWDRLDEHLSDEREIVITRQFDAPRAQVFAAWTDQQTIGQWWGPEGFTTTTHEMDVREGGTWTFTMHGPDGTDYPNEVVYSEIEEPARLVYTHGSRGSNESASFEVTVTFSGRGDTTWLTLRHRYDSAEERQASLEFGALEGGEQSLGRLARYLSAGT